MWHKNANRSPNGDTQPGYAGQERRTAPRIETPFPAKVRSVDTNDQRFEEHTVLDNLSSCGLYLRLAWRVAPGTRLFVVVRLSAALNADASAAWVALCGVVLRTEPRPGGIFGTAITITHHRFIDGAAQSITNGAARWPNREKPDSQTEAILKGGREEVDQHIGRLVGCDTQGDVREHW